jgi:peptidoglycan/LPS O-acetylase OafA/YrhL
MHGAQRLVEGESRSVITYIFYDTPNNLHFGRIGVVIFFALSGYLIARSLEGPGWKISFPIKRAFRLYPIYVFSILSVLLLMGPQWDFYRLLANLTMVPTLFGQEEYLGLYWTLQTEVIFYAVFYWATWTRFGASRSFSFYASVFFTALFILEQLLIDQSVLNSLPLMIKKLPQHLGIMFWGAFLYRAEKEDYLGVRILGLTAFVLLPSLVALGEYALSGIGGSPTVITSYLTAVGICFLVFYSKFSNRLFEVIGRISYSVYLNHVIVLYFLLETGISFGLLGGMAVLILGTFLLSWVTYRLIEKPAIRVSRKVVG